MTRYIFKLRKQPLLVLILFSPVFLQLRESSASQLLKGLIHGRQHTRTYDKIEVSPFLTKKHMLAYVGSPKKRKRRKSKTSNKEFVADAEKKKLISEPMETLQKNEKMPCLFTDPEEVIYDKYAACLAATESLRRARDTLLKNKGKTIKVGSKSSKKMLRLWSPEDRELKKRGREEWKRAYERCIFQSGQVIRSLGLSVGEFNQLGKEIESDGVLKERVMEQAYLYRIASSVNKKKIPLIEDLNSRNLLKAHRRRRVQLFARSIIEIEDLRAQQTNRLRQALNIEALPLNIKISDPTLLPILDPRVRAVVQAFPLQAEEIVKKYGLNSDEFNEMLVEARANPVFRWRLKNYMKKHDQPDGVLDL